MWKFGILCLFKLRYHFLSDNVDLLVIFWLLLLAFVLRQMPFHFSPVWNCSILGDLELVFISALGFIIILVFSLRYGIKFHHLLWFLNSLISLFFLFSWVNTYEVNIWKTVYENIQHLRSWQNIFSKWFYQIAHSRAMFTRTVWSRSSLKQYLDYVLSF